MAKVWRCVRPQVEQVISFLRIECLPHKGSILLQTNEQKHWNRYDFFLGHQPLKHQLHHQFNWIQMRPKLSLCFVQRWLRAQFNCACVCVHNVRNVWAIWIVKINVNASLNYLFWLLNFWCWFICAHFNSLRLICCVRVLVDNQW